MRRCKDLTIAGVTISTYVPDDSNMKIEMLEPTHIFGVRCSKDFKIGDDLGKITTYTPEVSSVVKVFKRKNSFIDGRTGSPKILSNRLSIFPECGQKKYEVFFDIDYFNPSGPRISLRPSFISRSSISIRERCFSRAESQEPLNDEGMRRLDELTNELNRQYFRELLSGKK
jgi:hypothetical protein